MMKIYINEECFYVPEESNMKGKSGNVYHIKTNNEDIAAKIYHINSASRVFKFPEEFELDAFIKAYNSEIPVLLSKYKITDEEGSYIGCATDFVTETRGKTIDAVKKIPIDLLINCLYDIESTIPYFKEKNIYLCDWQLENMKLGTIMNDEKERLYIFDDSSYRLCFSNNEDKEANKLVQSILARYSYLVDSYAYNILFTNMKKETSYVSYLETVTRGYNNLEDCLKDFSKVYTKK